MLKEQILKEYKPPSNKTFHISMSVLVFGLCVNLIVTAIYLDRASDWAAIENLSLLDLTKIDTDQVYKGTTVKALECLNNAFAIFLVCIVLTIPLCFARYNRRKQKKLLSLINQIPDEI